MVPSPIISYNSSQSADREIEKTLFMQERNACTATSSLTTPAATNGMTEYAYFPIIKELITLYLTSKLSPFVVFAICLLYFLIELMHFSTTSYVFAEIYTPKYLYLSTTGIPLKLFTSFNFLSPNSRMPLFF